VADVPDDLVQRFAALFAGNDQYHITCNVKRAKDKQNVTQKSAYTLDNIRAHLGGGVGIGTSPLLRDSTCRFAAIDIDCQDGADEVDFKSIADRVAKAGLPLVVCRTRSGGAHLYLFLLHPAPAKLIRTLIKSWADKLNIAGTDCLLPSVDFQQQEDDGLPRISRSINLPYHDVDKTVRYAFAADGETRLTLAQFLDRAEAKRADPRLLVSIPEDEQGQAPPCVQRMIKDGVPAGLRNEGLTQIAIYLKRVDKDDVLPRLAIINDRVVDPPLKMDELRKIAKSTARRDYLYRCKIEPSKGLCDSAVCVTREFGIKPSEQNQNEVAAALADLPAIDDIARVQDSEAGGVYRIRINGHTFTAKAKQLMSVRDAQLLFVERIGVILPGKLTFGQWYEFIMERIRDARIDIQAEEDTEHGALAATVNDFIAGRLKAADDSVGAMQNRARLEAGPIREGKEVLFRLSTFERYCRDKRLSLPPTQMATVMLLRKCGARSKRVRTPSGVVGVWILPHQTDEHEQHFDELPAADPNSDY
jgi:hypothetical protein